jgi:hypothetical protein
MKVRREGWRDTAVERLTYWWEDHWRTALFVAIGLSLATGIIVLNGRESSRPPVYEDGVVVRFGAYPKPGDDEGAALLVVIVLTASGRIEQASANGAGLAQCRVGQRIRLVRHGGFLAADNPACPLSPS